MKNTFICLMGNRQYDGVGMELLIDKALPLIPSFFHFFFLSFHLPFLFLSSIFLSPTSFCKGLDEVISSLLFATGF